MTNNFVSGLELSVRSSNVLREMGVTSVESFMSLTRTDILSRRNAGTKTWREIEEVQQSMKSKIQGQSPRDTYHDIVLVLQHSGLSPFQQIAVLEAVKFNILKEMNDD